MPSFASRLIVWVGFLLPFSPCLFQHGPYRLSSALCHSFAAKAVRRGVSPFVLNKLLGHADLKTTMRYVHTSDFDDLAAALDLMA